MSRRRFSTLKASLRNSRPLGSDGKPNGVATVPATSPAGQYQAYQKQDVVPEYVRTTASKPGELVQVSINPFAKPIAAENRAIVKFSKRVQDKTEVEGFEAVANHFVLNAETDDALMGFIPAKAIVTIKGAVSSTPGKSQITGRSYVKRNNSSHTIPFGAAASKGYLEVKADLLAVAKASTTTKFSLRFRNEQI